MSCSQTIADYALRSIGFGARLLPKADITLCEQVVLIGSGMIWNIYYGVLAITIGFFFATALAVARAGNRVILAKAAEWFVFVFRGSPLFIQFFLVYEIFVLLPRFDIEIPLGFTTILAETRWLTKAWAGALIVLFLNTSAYSAEIFYGALKAIPTGDIEAADAYGMSGYSKFRRIVWPTLLRLAWPSYTNEAIFLFHSTTLVFLSSFPTWRQKGDALYYANYLAEKTFDPFVAYPIVAAYFILLTFVVILVFSLINRRLNRHLSLNQRPKLKYRPQIMLAR